MARVYISSTFEDLNEYRTAAADACSNLGHIAVKMEDFGATDIPPIEKSLGQAALRSDHVIYRQPFAGIAVSVLAKKLISAEPVTFGYSEPDCGRAGQIR